MPELEMSKPVVSRVIRHWANTQNLRFLLELACGHGAYYNFDIYNPSHALPTRVECPTCTLLRQPEADKL